MCGILGILANENASTLLDDREIIAMRDTMMARGPDGAGLFREGSVALAHRRLAIRDLVQGKQPWASQDDRFVLVFNGELYNDDELRSALRSRGVQFRTKCDTEVLVEAWSAWGEDCIGKLRGMFAFGVYDRRSRETWLVRDRCGVKPLFYSDVGSDFVFASSIAAIKKHPRFSPQPNFGVLRHYKQTLRITMDDESVFQDVFTVRPAELIHITSRGRDHRIYWELPSPVADDIEFDEAVMAMESMIEEAVKIRLKSDVPVGMMMSGGVDSNTLASFTRRHHQTKVLGVCGGGVDQSNGDAGPDFEFAHECACELGFDYSESRIKDDDYLETWQSLISQYETPISTPTDVIIYHVAQRLSRSVGVALGGEGADEAFCGYAIPHWSGQDFDLARSLGQWDSPGPQHQIRESLLRQYGKDDFSSASDHYLTTNSLIPAAAQRALFKPGYWRLADSCLSPETYYERLFASQGEMPMAQKYARVLFQVNLESLLSRLDSSTMAAGLEARVPYTDHLLVEQAFRYPHHFKIDVCPAESKPWLSSMELAQRGSLRSKRILRAVAGRLMPRRLACRPKMSFPTPLQTWMNGSWKSWIADRLSASHFANEVFEPSALRELTQLPSGMAIWNWPVINTVLWGDHCFG